MMKLTTRFSRFAFGLACLLLVVTGGFLWVGSTIPTWNASPEEVTRALPGDEIVPQPQLSWNHAITIQASPEQIYPWLIQMGDTRAAYYSFTFVENIFMIAANDPGRYINAGAINPEWQNPPIGQGMIMNYMAISEYEEGRYVLASATPEMPGFQWTWLWFLEPVDPTTTRLIVRHRFIFPPDVPLPAVKAVLNAGYVMERGMMIGIRDRSEGKIPPPGMELTQIILWLVAFGCGAAAAVRFIRQPNTFHPLGIGLEAVVILFIFTFIQPAIWVRILLDLLLIVSVWIAHKPGRASALIRRSVPRQEKSMGRAG